MKLCWGGGFRLDIRKRLFSQGLLGPWDGLSREVVTTPSLSELKNCLDNAFRLRV